MLNKIKWKLRDLAFRGNQFVADQARRVYYKCLIRSDRMFFEAMGDIAKFGDKVSSTKEDEPT